MKFLTPIGNLSQIGGGTLLAGVVPIDRLIRTSLSHTNPGVVTVLAGGAVILSSGTTLIRNNDWVFFGIEVTMLKGATPGNTRFEAGLDEGGGSSIIFLNLSNELRWRVGNHGAAETITAAWFGVGRCTLDSMYSIEVSGVSVGSNGTIGVGEAEANILILRNS